jgi:hypothetical protein
MIPQIRDNLHLHQVLDKDHVARTAIYSDTPPYIPAKTEGIMMTRYVPVKRARNTQSIRDGTGLVGKRAATTELEAYERPRIQELERILGLNQGTLTPRNFRHCQKQHEKASGEAHWGAARMQGC